MCTLERHQKASGETKSESVVEKRRGKNKATQMIAVALTNEEHVPPANTHTHSVTMNQRRTASNVVPVKGCIVHS